MSELAKINACAKRPIDIWTNFIYYPLSIRLVYAVRKTGITPNALTISSLIIALVGCAFFLRGVRQDVLIGLLLVQISYVVDCADGQLARYKQQFSPVGGWIDQVADRIKEFSIYTSLAYGYTRLHGSDNQIWLYAMFALFVLYLLEYYGQIRMGKPQPAVSAQPSATREEDAQSQDGFARAQRLRAFIPFRGFLIGEQYFALLAFIVFDAVRPFFLFVGILGGLMCIYRPVIQYVKLKRNSM
ncbi:CDP-alcohol phosphatidyltransferase family protein [Alicyclobacillus fastidiosus]|uniref:CDP-alcohol phosphatidyltransferase family protein n=1 Tax=Alicyclobacillus fastidiosus TaxID=392011 RepID=A0ABV5ADR9_9BACL|nr:CDP-alcohol phosphatidyltransferase family protein [Alicyclobacillus fastidiosus]WEH08664.1 CDP-alcohol phosphatidyltransferase family protein [Alicyclobacillus fastidiosus]